MIIIVTICLLVYVLCSSRGREVSVGPAGWPIIGHLPYLLRPNFHRILRSWSDMYGPMYKINVFGMPGIILSDPAAIRTVLCRSKETLEVPKHVTSYKELNALWGGKPSLFTSEHGDETWRLVRKAVAPAFSTANVR